MENPVICEKFPGEIKDAYSMGYFMYSAYRSKLVARIFHKYTTQASVAKSALFYILYK